MLVLNEEGEDICKTCSWVVFRQNDKSELKVFLRMQKLYNKHCSVNIVKLAWLEIRDQGSIEITFRPKGVEEDLITLNASRIYPLCP